MTTLYQLKLEAREQKDWQTKPRTFLAVIGQKPINGVFIDPFLNGVKFMVRELEDKIVYLRDVEMASIQAWWVD